MISFQSGRILANHFPAVMQSSQIKDVWLLNVSNLDRL